MLTTVGERLKHLRDKKRLTQTEIADQLGISQSTYVRYEQNKIKRYKEDVFAQLAEILSTTSAYILGEENSDPRLAHLPEYLHSFIYNPESSPYIAEAYLMFMGNKVRRDVQEKHGNNGVTEELRAE
jgi:Predicted transcriptional regulators